MQQIAVALWLVSVAFFRTFTQRMCAILLHHRFMVKHIAAGTQSRKKSSEDTKTAQRKNMKVTSTWKTNNLRTKLQIFLDVKQPNREIAERQKC